MKNSFSIRRCALPDLDAIMELQQHISDTMTNPDLFVATDRADNRVSTMRPASSPTAPSIFQTTPLKI